MSSRSTIDGAALPLAVRKRIDADCDRFEAAWRAGERPDLAAFLPEAEDPARVALFRELLALDVEFRRGDGERPEAETYRARFPEHLDLIDTAFRHNGSYDGSATYRRDRDATRIGARPEWGATVEPAADALRAAGYEVDRELGRGGMGVVYRAHQAALNRTVALKVIRAGGFASEGERRRFQNEAEAVAQLDHPHIVPVYEVGESRGLNYFSMKLVEGEGLDRRLGDYPDDPRAAARLVADVAEAIHHAHRRGILHRDLKPANILVDDRGAPHVTDFGLARRVDADCDLTHSGVILGTPSYMSPEQASGARGTLTTATDIYGLGAILYALLAGRSPHRGSSFAELLDMVRGSPPEPPSKLNRRVPRDLETICLKCLEKDPQRRYADAQALADDLRRWLSGVPIAARPVGPATRAWMWCRRHPLPAALGLLLALSVLVGFAGVAWKWREADQERSNYAAVADFLDGMIASSSTEVNPRGARFTVLEMLDRAAARICGDFQGRPVVEASIRERVGRSYVSLGEYARAEPHLRAALTLNRGLYGPEHPTTLRVANLVGSLLAATGRVAEAEATLRRSLDACRRAVGPEGAVTLDATARLGVLLREQRRLNEAEPLLRRTLDLRRRLLRPDHPDTLRSIRDLCLQCLDRARFAEAEAFAYEYEHGVRCAHGPKHPENVTALANRGLIRLLQGKPAEAEPYYRQALEAARRILGPEHPTTLAAADDHARVLHELARSRPGAP